MRLILVRHGQTPSNVHHFLDTAVPGPPLTELGLAQARALPQALADQSIDLVYASTLTRTQMTAAPLAAGLGLEVIVRDGLREVTAGEFEMANDEASVQSYLATMFAWSAGDLDLRMPGGENGWETFARYDAVVAEVVAATAGTVVMVSHGGIIRMWVAGRAGNLAPGFAAATPLGNTGMVVLDGSPSEGWRVHSWTDRMTDGIALPGSDDPGGRRLEPADPTGQGEG
jgi:broad specificity phosphatase PhoE